jgi:hypothetical protein
MLRSGDGFVELEEGEWATPLTSTLKMEATYLSEMLVSTYESTLRHNAEQNRHYQRNENHRPHIIQILVYDISVWTTRHQDTSLIFGVMAIYQNEMKDDVLVSTEIFAVSLALNQWMATCNIKFDL